jgi:hypothetical protein
MPAKPCMAKQNSGPGANDPLRSNSHNVTHNAKLIV